MIPNIRFGDYRTFRYCCDGISNRCVIAVGSHGTMKSKEDRLIFLKGFEYIIERLTPTAVLIYGTFPKELIEVYSAKGIYIIVYASDYAVSRREAV